MSEILMYRDKPLSVVSSGGSGSGGHIIVNTAGTSLSQRSKLKFFGTYTNDDSTNDSSVVNVTRTMTSAQYELLSEDEKAGIIEVTDESGTAITADDVAYDSDNSVKDMLDVQESYTIPTTPTDYGSFTFTRCGNMVQVEVFGAKVSEGQSFILITNSLPEKFRPTLSTRIVTLSFIDNASTPSAFELLIYSTGMVRMYGYSSTAKTYNIQDTKTYFV